MRAALLLGSLALLVLVSLRARAADAMLPERSVVLSAQAFAAAAPAYARLGFRVAAVPGPGVLVERRGLGAFAQAKAAVVVRPPFSRAVLESLRSYAQGEGCRIVVHAEGGFALGDLAALASVGPCFFELHLASDPSVFADQLAALRPAEVVWEAGSLVPALADLARLATLPRPYVAVDDEAAPRTAAALSELGDARVGLEVRAKDGELSAWSWDALAARDRSYPATVVAADGLAPASARRLRGLANVAVELSLERTGPNPGALRAAAILSRRVDPPNEPTMTDAEADAPLFCPPPLDPLRRRALKLHRRLPTDR